MEGKDFLYRIKQIILQCVQLTRWQLQFISRRYNNNVFQIYFYQPGNPKFVAGFVKKSGMYRCEHISFVCSSAIIPSPESFFCTLFCLTQYPVDVAVVSSSEEQFYFFFYVFLWVYGGGGVEANANVWAIFYRQCAGRSVGEVIEGGPQMWGGKADGSSFFTKNRQAVRIVVFMAGRILAASI